MPTIWYVREGPKPNTMNDPGMTLSSLDYQRAFSDVTPKFLSKEAPVFNAASPNAAVQRVVVEIRPDEDTDLTFPFPGFYLLPDMTPEEAKEELAELFATVTRTSRPPK
jgi:hypothetical protein